MRRTIRIDSSIGLLCFRTAKTLPSPFLCAVCHRQGLSFSTSPSRAADPKTPFTKRIQQKIWGTDQPPGLDDPYGGGGVFDQSKRRAPEKEVRQQEAQAPVEPDAQSPAPAVSSSYEPATTWDGLQKVGGFGGWWREHWDPGHQFEGFPPWERVTDAEVIVAALHRAIVEVFALQTAGKSLSAFPKVTTTWDPTDDVRIVPSSTGATLSFSTKTSLDQIIQTLIPSINQTSQKEASAESEEDAVADRSTVVPLHHESEPSTSVIDGALEKGQPTLSEEDVAADRSDTDPLVSNSISHKTYAEVIASWDPAWLEISLENPKIKFAVSSTPSYHAYSTNSRNRSSSGPCS